MFLHSQMLTFWYQELLGTFWLKLNCLLLVSQQPWDSRTLSIKRGREFFLIFFFFANYQKNMDVHFILGNFKQYTGNLIQKRHAFTIWSARPKYMTKLYVNPWSLSSKSDLRNFFIRIRKKALYLYTNKWQNLHRKLSAFLTSPDMW